MTKIPALPHQVVKSDKIEETFKDCIGNFFHPFSPPTMYLIFALHAPQATFLSPRHDPPTLVQL